jgi:hypothetical protein
MWDRWNGGERNVGPANIPALAKALGVEIHELFMFQAEPQRGRDAVGQPQQG